MLQRKVTFFNKKTPFHSIFIIKSERLGQPIRLFNHCSFHRLIRIRVKWCWSSGATLASDSCRFRPMTYPIRSSATPLPRNHQNPIVLSSLYSACSSSGLLLIPTPPLSAQRLIIHYQGLSRLSTQRLHSIAESTGPFTQKTPSQSAHACLFRKTSKNIKASQTNFAEACVVWTICHCFPAIYIGLLM